MMMTLAVRLLFPIHSHSIFNFHIRISYTPALIFTIDGLHILFVPSAHLVLLMQLALFFRRLYPQLSPRIKS